MDAIVCGAGAAGLAAAAMLQEAGFVVLVLERGGQVGSSWRTRYDGLRLNSLGWLSRLPGHARRWRPGDYPSSDEWVEYLERYATDRRLAIDFETAVRRIDRAGDSWEVETSDGPVHADVVVVATGYDREPLVPDWPGRESFRGKLLHAAEYRRAAPFRGKSVVVVGANTTGSELATLVARGGAAAVWVAMRTPPNLIKRRWRGLPLHAGALVLDRLPAWAADRLGWAVQRVVVGDLREYGLPRSPMGMKTTVVERGMGPAVDDVGFVDALKSGRIEVVGPVECLDGHSVVLAGGRRLRPDVVIAATGYRRGLEPLVGHLDVLLPDGRPRVTGDQTAPNAPGLYFIGFAAGLAGPLAQMRIDAKRIAKAAGSTG